MVSKSGGCNTNISRDDDNINININNKGGGGGGEVNLDNWRQYFRKPNSDIFDIIEHAIMVAASDFPNEYRVRKLGIAELLFTCRITRCLTCRRVELPLSSDHDVRDVNVGGNDDDVDVDVDIGGNEGVETELNNNNNSNINYGDVEALTDLMEQEKQLINEVLRIKDVLYNNQLESDSVLMESLRRLQLMHLTINLLKETEIGKAVNHIKRHSSKDIRNLARSLIAEWKIVVDEWVESTRELAEKGTPDSVNPSTVDEEEGLPSPPMDEGVFFTTQTMDFNQFFDGMDDDGNPRNCGEFNKNRETGRKPAVVKPGVPKRREEPPKEETPASKDNRPRQMNNQLPLPKPSKPSSTPSGNGRPLKPNGDDKLPKDLKCQLNHEKPVVQRRPTLQPEKPRSFNEGSVQEKLEATKRKLQERYQQAENAKRQRTIQVMEIQDLPKQGHVNKNLNAKFGNLNRNWANGRK
ncbi:putative mediator of RNA polymerase II transcription subunit 26b [Silene latifolia]|uniref:putative mediator of RNA polymerase II transcription subunit 26b n=1 Tax=Silene latifolia TaxID=37657 RepID=UPI003D7840C1